MLLPMGLVTLWALLMFRSALAEYKYYQSVKTLEPEIWQRLGSPKCLKVPFVFVSASGSAHLKTVENPSVRELARKHRVAGIQFLSYIVVVLLVGTVYFKVA